MLTRFALRSCCIMALRGKTSAGLAVYDSAQDPLDDGARAEPRPAIVVYTDDSRGQVSVRDLFAPTGDMRTGGGHAQLVIEIAVTQQMRMTDETGREVSGVAAPETNAALELAVERIERQIAVALSSAAPEARWAELFRRFAVDISSVESQRGANVRDGVRFAGRQLRYTLRLLREPEPGRPLGPVWSAFLDLARADAEMAPLVPMLLADLNDPADPTTLARYPFGSSRAEAAALLL